MKVLFDPVFTARDISRCATHFSFQQMAEIALANGHMVYYLLPDPASGFQVSALEHPNIRYFERPYMKDRYRELFGYSNAFDMIASFGPLWDWDVMVTVRVPCLPSYRMFTNKGRATHRRRTQTVRRRIMAFDVLPLLNAKVTVALCEEGEWMTTLGYAAADKIVICSEHEVPMIRDAARRYLSPQLASDVIERIEAAIIYPVPLDFTAAYNRKPPKGDLRVCYIQRLSKAQKQPQDALKIMAHLFQSRSGCELRVFSNSGAVQVAKFAREYPWVRFSRPPREQYLKELRGSHVFVTTSVDEELPLGLAEAIDRRDRSG